MATYTAVTGMSAVTAATTSSTLTGTADTRLRLAAYGLSSSDEYIDVLVVTPAGNQQLYSLEEDRGIKPVRLNGQCTVVNLDGSYDYAFYKNQTSKAVTLYKVT
jgi:hypothetical protein